MCYTRFVIPHFPRHARVALIKSCARQTNELCERAGYRRTQEGARALPQTPTHRTQVRSCN